MTTLAFRGPTDGESAPGSTLRASAFGAGAGGGAGGPLWPSLTSASYRSLRATPLASAASARLIAASTTFLNCSNGTTPEMRCPFT